MAEIVTADATPLGWGDFYPQQGSAPAPATPAPALTHDFVGVGLPPTKQPEPGKTTGWGSNAWAAVQEGVANTNRMIEMAQPWRVATEFVDETFGTHLAPRSVSQNITELPSVKDVQPDPATWQGPMRKFISGAVTMAAPAAVGKLVPGASMLAPGGILGAPFVGGTASVLGHEARQLVPEQYGDVVDAGTQLAVGAGMFGAGALARGALEHGMGPLSFRGPKPVIDPYTGQPFTAVAPEGTVGTPIQATPVAQQRAAEILTKGLGEQTPDAAAAAIPKPPISLLGQPIEEVPGVQLTTGQLTGNTDQLVLERKLANLDRAPFNIQENKNNLARVAALNNQEPAAAIGAASDHFQTLHAAARAEEAAAVTAARTGAETAIADAGVPPRAANEVQLAGERQRGALEAERTPVRQALNEAYDAIDPDGTMTLNTTPVVERARQIRQELGMGGRLTGEEAEILSLADRFNGVQSFSDLRSLASTIKTQMRAFRNDPKVGAESLPYRRLGQLLDSVEGSITDAAGRAVAADTATAGSRLIDRLAGTAEGSVNRETFSATDAANLADANRNYANYKKTYREGAVGDVLQSGQGGYKLSDAAVPGRIMRAGPAGADAADSLIRASGGDVAKAQTILGDHPAMVYRNEVMKDGAVDVAAHNRFMAKYGPLLDKFPDLKAKFGNAATAEQAVIEAAARGRAKVEDLENSAASYYLGRGQGGVDPQVAIGRLMSSENPALAAADLMRRAQGSEAAVAGIRRNFIDWLQTKSQSIGHDNRPIINGQTFLKLINDPKTARAIETLLTPEQGMMLRRVGKNLAQMSGTWRAPVVRGSPGTAADLLTSGGGDSFISQYLWQMGGQEAGAAIGNLVGVGGPVASALNLIGMMTGVKLQGRRADAMKNVMDLVTQASLNPNLGRVLLEKAAKNPRAPIMKDTARKIIMFGTRATLGQ